MAYLNFSEVQGAPVLARAAPARVTGFSALEWSVVALAQRDSLATLREPGALSIAFGMVFGGERPNPRLADTRLEALRRLSVFAWHKGYAVPISAIRAFHEAGFTIDQLETLLDSISQGRGERRR